MSTEREVHILLADGVEVFAHRSHDAVVAKYRELTGSTYRIEMFDDLDDPDKSEGVLTAPAVAAHYRV